MAALSLKTAFKILGRKQFDNELKILKNRWFVC